MNPSILSRIIAAPTSLILWAYHFDPITTGSISDILGRRGRIRGELGRTLGCILAVHWLFGQTVHDDVVWRGIVVASSELHLLKLWATETLALFVWDNCWIEASSPGWHVWVCGSHAITHVVIVMVRWPLTVLQSAKVALLRLDVCRARSSSSCIQAACCLFLEQNRIRCRSSRTWWWSKNKLLLWDWASACTVCIRSARSRPHSQTLLALTNALRVMAYLILGRYTWRLLLLVL